MLDTEMIDKRAQSDTGSLGDITERRAVISALSEKFCSRLKDILPRLNSIGIETQSRPLSLSDVKLLHRSFLHNCNFPVIPIHCLIPPCYPISENIVK